MRILHAIGGVILASLVTAIVGCKSSPSPTQPVITPPPPAPWNPIDTLFVVLHDEANMSWTVYLGPDSVILGPGQNQDFIDGFIYDKRVAQAITVVGLSVGGSYNYPTFERRTYAFSYPAIDSAADTPPVSYDPTVHMPKALLFDTRKWQEQVCNPIGQCIWYDHMSVELTSLRGTAQTAWPPPTASPITLVGQAATVKLSAWAMYSGEGQWNGASHAAR